MPTMVFINLAVNDLQKSIDFYTKVGYTFNPQFTDENGTCMIISDTIYAMLMTREKFAGFTDKNIIDAKTSIQVMNALMVESREEVHAICERAFAAGGRKFKEPEDHGFMLGWGYEDLDGHIWEVGYMDPSFVQ